MKSIFTHQPTIFGMIHVPALPGTPAYRGQDRILEQVVKEARVYCEAGLHGIIIENMHDTPYLKGKVGPEITAWMTRVGMEVKRVCGDLPCGVQVLAGANKEALAVAQAAGLDFVRVEGFVFGHVADEGWIEASAGELLRYRKQIDAEHIRVFADIKKKHSAHAVTADVSLAETAKAASFFRVDGVIVTGASTALPADAKAVKAVQEAIGADVKVLVGSGVNVENVDQYLHADGLIVGSSFKRDGNWQNEVDRERVAAFMNRVYHPE